MKFNLNRKTFGFGALAGEDDLNKDLTNAFGGQTNPQSRFDRSVGFMVNKIVMTGLGPWMSSVFTKYPPIVFHQKMAQGFDFVKDLHANHYVEMNRYIGAAKGMVRRGVLQLNSQALYNNITGMMAKRGYMLTPAESQTIFRNINEIVQMIYSP